MDIIAVTDPNWFNFLKNNDLHSNVNFWQPTYQRLNRINEGDRVYFKIKGERIIAGYGEFVEQRELTVNEAWRDFGQRNGCEIKKDFINIINQKLHQHSQRIANERRIGSIVLNNCVYLDTFIVINDTVWNPRATKSFRYMKDGEKHPVTKRERITDFQLVKGPRTQKTTTTNTRSGQSDFSSRIRRAYNNTCCISGETIPELLEAAHIQEYKSKDSQHVQNGLLLRVDLHRLYDSGLIFINDKYEIQVSSKLNGTIYEIYRNRSINYHKDKRYKPSKDALMSRLQNFRA